MAAAIIGPKFYGWDDNGDPLAYGKLYTYEPGTTTPKPTYTNEDGLVENSNPVILNAAGWADVYLTGSYAMVLTDKDDNEIWTEDPVTDAPSQVNEWINQKNSSYVSPAVLKVDGNHTDLYSIGRAIQVKDVSEKIGFVLAAEYLSGETFVTVSLGEPLTTSVEWIRVGIITENSLPQATINIRSALSIGDLPGISNPQDGRQISLKGWRPGTSLGGGNLYWDSNGDKADHNGITVFDPSAPYPIDYDDSSQVEAFLTYSGSGLGVWRRINNSDLIVEMAGAIGNGVFDNTPCYNAIVNSMPDGTNVKFGTNGTYIGHFISPSKSFCVDANGATLVNSNNSDGILVIGDFNVTEYSVSETTLEHGETKFTVVGSSGVFEEGDIGYLWDQAVRPTGGSCNFEVVRIADITSDVITVDGFLASYKGASAIKFYRSENQIKNPKIKNAFINPTPSHIGFGAACFNTENPIIKNIETKGTTGNAVSVRYSYGATIENIRPLNPQSVVSGNGYGVALFAVSRFSIKDVHGMGCRHVYDQDSAYFGDIENISDMDDQSAPVALGHNGFAGYISCKNVRCRTEQYPVSFSEQGYGGTPSADKDKHPLRNIIIDGVDSVIKSSVTPNTSNVPGVYFQNTVVNVDVKNIRIRHESSVSLTNGALSFAVRVIGIVEGYFNIENIHADKVGSFFYADGEGQTKSVARIRNLNAENVSTPIRAFGKWGIDLDSVFLENNPLSAELVEIGVSGVDSPFAAYIGDNIEFGFVSALLENTAVVTSGRLPLRSSNSGTAIIVASGQAITAIEIQNRNKYCNVVGPAGSGTVTLSATEALPKPMVNGAELFLTHTSSGRQDVEFPAGNNIASTFTLNYNSVIRLVATGGKWNVYSKSLNI